MMPAPPHETHHATRPAAAMADSRWQQWITLRAGWMASRASPSPEPDSLKPIDHSERLAHMISGIPRHARPSACPKFRPGKNPHRCGCGCSTMRQKDSCGRFGDVIDEANSLIDERKLLMREQVAPRRRVSAASCASLFGSASSKKDSRISMPGVIVGPGSLMPESFRPGAEQKRPGREHAEPHRRVSAPRRRDFLAGRRVFLPRRQTGGRHR